MIDDGLKMLISMDWFCSMSESDPDIDCEALTPVDRHGNPYEWNEDQQKYIPKPIEQKYVDKDKMWEATVEVAGNRSK